MAEFVVVLLKVARAANLGAIARVMKNFGVTRMVLIEPKCSPKDREAWMVATHAREILDGAETMSREDLRQFDLVVGTTGKLGDDYNIPRVPLFPSKVAPELARRKGTVALLFGPEDDGLRNEDLDLCDYSLMIPTSEEQPSMNVSHAVAVTLYALRAPEHEERIARKYPLVRAAEKRQIGKMIDELLDKYRFTRDERKQTQRVLWRRLVGKSALTQREAMALLGFLSKALTELEARGPAVSRTAGK